MARIVSVLILSVLPLFSTAQLHNNHIFVPLSDDDWATESSLLSELEAKPITLEPSYNLARLYYNQGINMLEIATESEFTDEEKWLTKLK